MEANGRIKDAIKTANGTTIITFEAASIGLNEELNNLMKETEIKAVFERYTNKRSLNANAYFWVLCDKIAKKLGKGKWEVYLQALKDYGTFIDIAIQDKALPFLKAAYREVEILEEGILNGEKASYVRCYIGSSQYDKEEMNELINGIVEDAKSLGIDVLPPDEIKRMVDMWKGNFNEF